MKKNGRERLKNTASKKLISEKLKYVLIEIIKSATTGRLTSKRPFDVIGWTKNQRNFSQDFCPSL